MKLKEGMGEKIAIISNLLGTTILCLITAFPIGWELTLACLSVMPFSITASVLLSNVSNHNYVTYFYNNSLIGILFRVFIRKISLPNNAMLIFNLSIVF